LSDQPFLLSRFRLFSSLLLLGQDTPVCSAPPLPVPFPIFRISPLPHIFFPTAELRWRPLGRHLSSRFFNKWSCIRSPLPLFFVTTLFVVEEKLSFFRIFIYSMFRAFFIPPPVRKRFPWLESWKAFPSPPKPFSAIAKLLLSRL